MAEKSKYLRPVPNEQEVTERAICEAFGIEAEGSSLCPHCELWHLPYRPCPPVLPLGTAYWEGLV